MGGSKNFMSNYVANFRTLLLGSYPGHKWNISASFNNQKTDLCLVCQQNAQIIMSTADKSEADKMEVLESHKAHLLASRKEGNYYQEACELAKEEVHRALSPFLFYYAQQLNYPADPLQPGPIYFKTSLKCQLFGVVAKPTQRQVNYLVHEGLSIS